MTNEHFTERDLLNAPLPLAPSSHQKQDVTLKLKVAPEMTYRVYNEFDEDNSEKQPDGSYIVSVTWPEDDWVYGTILSFGEYIEILEPEHIRTIICEKAKKYL